MIGNGQGVPAGAAAIVTALAGAGTQLMVGLPGGGPNLDVVRAAAAAGIRFVLARTETAAVIMAATYADLTGRPGAAVVTRGPGLASAICLIGDAAFAVRPHAAAGTAKAAADGWALAEELTAAGGDVPAALAAWERRQLALGRDLLARCRAIGDSSQFSGTFRPGDPRLIFGLYGPGN